MWEKRDRSATCLPDLTLLQPAGGKDGERAASRRLPGWPELKSQGTTIKTIAAAVATLAQNKTFSLISCSTKQHSAGGRPISSSGFPNLFRPPQTKPHLPGCCTRMTLQKEEELPFRMLARQMLPYAAVALLTEQPRQQSVEMCDDCVGYRRCASTSCSNVSCFSVFTISAVTATSNKKRTSSMTSF